MRDSRANRRILAENGPFAPLPLEQRRVPASMRVAVWQDRGVRCRRSRLLGGKEHAGRGCVGVKAACRILEIAFGGRNRTAAVNDAPFRMHWSRLMRHCTHEIELEFERRPTLPCA